jgi:Leucine-rich repeat (LRR) protein
LAQLIFGDNKIEKLETILPLKDLDKLTEIDFQNNPVASAADYRSKIFEAYIRCLF